MTDKPSATEGLLPCPFCGSADVDRNFVLSSDGTNDPGCMTCGGNAPMEVWNKRTSCEWPRCMQECAGAFPPKCGKRTPSKSTFASDEIALAQNVAQQQVDGPPVLSTYTERRLAAAVLRVAFTKTAPQAGSSHSALSRHPTEKETGGTPADAAPSLPSAEARTSEQWFQRLENDESYVYADEFSAELKVVGHFRSRDDQIEFAAKIARKLSSLPSSGAATGDLVQDVLKAIRAIPLDSVPDIEKAVADMNKVSVAAYFHGRGINQAESAFLEVMSSARSANATMALREFYEGVKECMGDTWQCPTCGHAEDWWKDCNADYATREAVAKIEAPVSDSKAEDR